MGYNLKILIQLGRSGGWDGNKILVRGESTEEGGEFFQVGVMSTFSAGGGDSAHPPNRRNSVCSHSKLYHLCFRSNSYVNLIITKNELKTQDVKLTFKRKFVVQTWLGAWPDFRNPILLQGPCFGPKIRVTISKLYD